MWYLPWECCEFYTKNIGISVPKEIVCTRITFLNTKGSSQYRKGSRILLLLTILEVAKAHVKIQPSWKKIGLEFSIVLFKLVKLILVHRRCTARPSEMYGKRITKMNLTLLYTGYDRLIVWNWPIKINLTQRNFASFLDSCLNEMQSINIAYGHHDKWL